MIREGLITELVKHGGDLFAEAAEQAHKRDLILSSPLVIARDGAAAKNSIEDTVAQAISIEQSGVGRVSLASGQRGNGGLPIPFYDCISGIRKNTGLDISVNFGVLNKAHLVILKEVGVKSVSCALPAAGFQAFREAVSEDGYEARMKTLREAKESGLETCINLVIGLNEFLEDIDAIIRIAEQLGIDFLSISCIWPTLLTEEQDRYRLNFMGRIAAASRLCLPDDTDIGIACYSLADCVWGMRCGANAFTVALRQAYKTPKSPGDETNWLKTMWRDYSNTSESYERFHPGDVGLADTAKKEFINDAKVQDVD